MNEELQSATPADRLLLQCLNKYFHPESALTEWHGASQSIDWTLFLALADEHRIGPLLLEALTRAPQPTVPATVMSALRSEATATSFYNLRLTRELIRIVEVFHERDIDVTPFKGPVVAQALYGNLGLRHFRDLDVLILRQQLDAACAALESEGYRREFPWSRTRLALYRFASAHHYAFDHDDRTQLELHWRVARPCLDAPAETARAWDRRITVSIAGHSLAMHAPEDLLLLLCLHGARHWWDRLCWVCDIAALIRTYPALDWETLTQRARATGRLRVLHLGLNVAQTLLGVKLPSAVSKSVDEDRVVKSLTAEVRQLLLTRATEPEDRRLRWSFYLRLLDRPQDRARFIAWQPLNSLFWRVMSTNDNRSSV